jgi:tellurite resistance protein TerC
MLESLPFLTMSVAGQPLWLWAAFLSFIGVLLWLDLGVINNKDGVVSAKKSALMWAAFASLSVAFGGYVYFIFEPDPFYYNSPENLNSQALVQYFTGYLLETALAFDNIFVMSLIFTYMAVPREYQHRVLFWGIIGAIVFRGIFIGLGSAIVNQFTWVLFIFAGFLVFSGYKMLFGAETEHSFDDNFVLKLMKKRLRVTETISNHNFFVKAPHPDRSGKLVLWATPLFLTLMMVEVADIIFAVDSVPAILAVTRDPFIVYTSNIFAILGLRSMYFMLAEAMERFRYLKYGLALVLVLIGAKIIWNFGLAKSLHWVPYLEPHWSLIATLSLLGGSILYSLWRTRGEDHAKGEG